MNTQYKPLEPAIKNFYDKMAQEYQSNNERTFFETIKERQQHVFTYANDVLLSEYDNEDELFIVRHYFDEFEIGKAGLVKTAYAMDIEDAMAINLYEAGLLAANITLLEWLRARDYKGIRYDGNFDEL